MILLITGSGEPNYGDDLILKLWINYYRTIGYDQDIVVDCKSISGSIELHNFDQNVYFTKYIKKLTTGRKYCIDEYITIGESHIQENHLFKGWNAAKRKSFNILNFKLIHLIGGGYINGNWPNSFAIFGAINSIKKLNNHVKIVATGLGLMPLEEIQAFTMQRVSRIISESFDLFEVRDEYSYFHLNKHNFSTKIINGYDDTFIAPIDKIVSKEQLNNDSPAIHISSFIKTPRDIQLISQSVENLANKGYKRVIFWECNIKDSDNLDELKKVIKLPSVNIKTKQLIYGQIPFSADDYLITSRFHPHLICFRLGMIGKYLSTSSFYDFKHLSIKRLGSPFESGDARFLPETLREVQNNTQFSEKIIVSNKCNICNAISNCLHQL